MGTRRPGDSRVFWRSVRDVGVMSTSGAARVSDVLIRPRTLLWPL